jgi:putative copper resistance protein D
MEQLVDLFGYLSIVFHGLTILSQSVALGGVLFLVLLARPLHHPVIAAGTTRIAGHAAIALLLSEAATIALQATVLAETVDLSLFEVLTADFALAGLVKTAVAAVLALLLLKGARVPGFLLLALAIILNPAVG